MKDETENLPFGIGMFVGEGVRGLGRQPENEKGGGDGGEERQKARKKPKWRWKPRERLEDARQAKSNNNGES